MIASVRSVVGTEIPNCTPIVGLFGLYDYTFADKDLAWRLAPIIILLEWMGSICCFRKMLRNYEKARIMRAFLFND
jgi:hypothetical protein